MNDHQFWNELGNLYFMSGAYQPAIHAYTQAILANRKFGRPYSNLALTLTQIGQYEQAIELYHRGLELLDDEKEKAATWNRLGVLYRQMKDYHSAVAAYQKADTLDPAQERQREEASREPLTVSMPNIDLQELLRDEDSEEKLVEDVNAELEQAEDLLDIAQWFDDDFVPPNPEVESALEALTAPETDSDQTDKLEETVITHGDWKPARFFEEESQPVFQSEIVDEPVAEAESPVMMTVEEDPAPIMEVESINTEPIIEEEIIMQEDETPVSEAEHETIVEVMEEPLWNMPVTQVRTQSEPIMSESIDMTEPEAVQYSQVEYPLTGAETFDVPDDHINKFKDATVKNPRSAIAWEELGEVYKKAGRYKDAIRAYERAIYISPKPSSYYRLGLVYAAERKEAQAIEAFQKTLELDPNHALAHASLASQYRKIGLNDQAEMHIAIATGTAFEDENEYNRACLEAICGNTERAISLLAIALQNKQTHVNWAKKDPDLDSLREEPRFQSLITEFSSL